MDIVLAEIDGEELLKIMRRAKTIPILVLSSKPGLESRLSAYPAGAHTYLEKPYELEECLAQELYAGLKLPVERCYTLVFSMDLMIDPERRIVTLKEQTLNLTRKEFELLFCLASHAGQILSREQLYSQVWNSESSYSVDETVNP